MVSFILQLSEKPEFKKTDSLNHKNEKQLHPSFSIHYLTAN